MPSSIKFKVVKIASVYIGEKEVLMQALEQEADYPVIFSQDLSTIEDASFTETGVALTKYGYMVGDARDITGTITLVATLYGDKFSGTLSSGEVTLTPVV